MSHGSSATFTIIQRCNSLPIYWWKALCGDIELSQLPFIKLYLNVLGGGFTGQIAELPNETTQETSVHNRIVEPVEGWDRFNCRQWGDNTDMIEEWFDAGDELQHVDTLIHDVTIDEPEPWERALSWVRSVLAPRPA